MRTRQQSGWQHDKCTESTRAYRGVSVLAHIVAIEATVMAAQEHSISKSHVIKADWALALLVQVRALGPFGSLELGIVAGIGRDETRHDQRVALAAVIITVAIGATGAAAAAAARGAALFVGVAHRHFVVHLHRIIDTIQEIGQVSQHIGLCHNKCSSQQTDEE